MGMPASVIQSPLERWAKGEDGHYHPQVLTFEWNPRELAALTELSEFGRVIDAVDSEPIIARHFDALVGTPTSRLRWEVRTSFFPFLPRPMTTDGVTFTLVERKGSFGEQYRALEQFFAGDTMPSTLIWPTPGLTLKQRALTLEAGVVLRRLTESEVVSCISGGLIRSTHPGLPLIMAPEHGFCALVVTKRVPKMIGDINPSDNNVVWASEQETATRELTEDLQSCAAVMGLKGLGLSGLMKATGWPMELSMLSYGTGAPAASLFYERSHLARSGARELARVWRSLRTVGRRANPALSLAARRLSYIAERLRPEDQMLDLMIAAEALYLTDAGRSADRGEMRYRLALRAAIWADTARLGLTRSEVLTLMKKAYDVRSAIAHGGIPDQRLLRLNGEQLDLSQFVERSGAVVRAGTRKAIDAAIKSKNGKFSVEWEALML
jgi:Apea-like HEPN